MQQCLYFLPLPQGQRSFRPTFCPVDAFSEYVEGVFANMASILPLNF